MQNWLFLLLCGLLALAGIFQLGYLGALSLYSTNFTLNTIDVWQVVLIVSGGWGIFGFMRAIQNNTK